MKIFYATLDRTLYFLLFIVLAFMSAVVAANVFGRFVLGVSISWGEEVAKILLTYLTFLGAAYAMRDNAHYTFDFLVQKMPSRCQRPLRAFRWLTVMIMVLVLIYYSGETTWMIRDWIMPSTGINRALVYGVAPLGLFFMFLYAGRNFVSDMKTAQLMEEKEVVDI